LCLRGRRRSKSKSRRRRRRKKRKKKEEEDKEGSKGQNNNSITDENLTTSAGTNTNTTTTTQENTCLASVVAAATVNALAVIHNNNNNNTMKKNATKTLIDDANKNKNKTLLNDCRHSRPRRSRESSSLSVSSSSSSSSTSLYNNENNTATMKNPTAKITPNEIASTKRTITSLTTPKLNNNDNKKKRRKINSLVKSLSTTNSLPSASSWQKQASTYLDCDSVGDGGSVKRLRQSFIAIDKTKLCKQKVKSYPRSRVHYYNKVVIRKRSSNVVDDDPRIARRYNGGSMIDHRYEYCFYFVLHYDESTSKIVLVPMIRNGLFMTGSKKRVGRFRYQCNILENNKNWIVQDAASSTINISKEYDVVMDATMIMKTSLVAQEAWDIYSNEEEAGYDDEVL